MDSIQRFIKIDTVEQINHIEEFRLYHSNIYCDSESSILIKKMLYNYADVVFREIDNISHIISLFKSVEHTKNYTRLYICIKEKNKELSPEEVSKSLEKIVNAVLKYSYC